MASTQEEEIARMVVRIIGDGSSYQKMTEQVIAATQKTAKEAIKTGEATDVLDSATKNLYAHMQKYPGQYAQLYKDFTKHDEVVKKVATSTNKLAEVTKKSGDATAKMAQQTSKGDEAAQAFGKTIGQLGTHMSNFAGQMRALAALQSPISFIYDSVRKAAESEKMESAFGTMLQSAEKGKVLVGDIQTLAAATPLNSADLMRTAKLLLQFNTGARDLIPTMRMLGDVTNGDAERLQHMSLAFGQMKAAGRLMGQDLLQMINAGFNPLQEMSRKTGKSMMELKQEMEKGAITTKMVEDAFKSATSQGGRFYNGMENASKTLSGLFSTMQDDIDATKRAVGAYIIEEFHLKEALQQVSLAAQAFTVWFQEIDPATRKAITAAALLAASFLALIVVWKVGAIIGGIIVGTLGNMYLTIKSLAFYVNILNFSFSGLFRTIKTGLATVYLWAPYIGIFIAIAAVVLMVVEELGGFEAAWEYVREAAKETLGWIQIKFAEFKEWVRPVTDALESLGVTAWAEFKANAHAAWDSVKEAFAAGAAFIVQKWAEMGGDAMPTWEELRTSAQRAIIFVEYAITHLEQVWNLAWVGMKLMGVKALNFILEHALLILAGPVILSGLLLFQTNWGAVITWVWNAFNTMSLAIGRVFIDVLVRVGDAIKQFLEDPTQGIHINWEGIFGNPADILKGLTLPGLPRALGTDKLEKDLQAEFDKIKNGTFADFEEFYKRKLKEFADFAPEAKNGKWAIWGQIFKPVLDGADAAAEGVKKLTHEIHKFDAALFGSGEANARIAAFRDMIGATSHLKPASPFVNSLPPAAFFTGAGGAGMANDPNPARRFEAFGREAGMDTKARVDFMDFKRENSPKWAEQASGATTDLLLKVLNRLDAKLREDADNGLVSILPADLE